METSIRLPRYDVSQHAKEGGYANAAKHGGGASAARARAGREPGGKWAREIDPNGTMDPAELAKRLRARLLQQMAKMTAVRRAKATARTASQPTPITAVLATICSWCHPKTAGRSHQFCERHGAQFERECRDYIHARQAGVIGSVA